MLGIFVSNWRWDLEEALRVAGLEDPSYNERLLEYAHEYQAVFPDEEPLTRANWRQAEADVLFRLGRGAEASAIMEELVTEFPTWGWLYSNWARHYLRQSDENGDAAAERILRRALEEPELELRHIVLESLIDLYERSGRPEEAAPCRKELRQIERRRRKESGRKLSPGAGLKGGPKRRKRKG
jgi:hypothetical protein